MEHLVVKKTEAIVSIQLNRPEVLNAFNEAMLEELYQVLQDIEKDPTLKVMILSGMGRAFSAGVDLKSTTADGFQQGGSFMELGLAVGNLLANMS
ncbi:MAG: enoyl-CoA hydratase/isomerase family protein, partial [Bacteroidota bacterium]